MTQPSKGTVLCLCRTSASPSLIQPGPRCAKSTRSGGRSMRRCRELAPGVVAGMSPAPRGQGHGAVPCDSASVRLLPSTCSSNPSLEPLPSSITAPHSSWPTLRSWAELPEAVPAPARGAGSPGEDVPPSGVGNSLISLRGPSPLPLVTTISSL